MSQTTSATTGRRYGLERVCRLWEQSRSALYARRARLQRSASADSPCRRGPTPALSDAQLLAAIRNDLARSPFQGEGHRKVHARLRILDGVRVSRTRVLRVMRAQGLLSPHRGRQGEPKPHDGTIVTSAPDVMWGTDGARVLTVDDGWVWTFAAVDHWNAECVGWHVCKVGDRFAALARHAGPCALSADGGCTMGGKPTLTRKGYAVRDAEVKISKRGTEYVLVKVRLAVEDPARFVDAYVAGRDRERAAGVGKGDVVAFMGSLSRRRYTGRDGEEREAWSCLCDTFTSSAEQPKASKPDPAGAGGEPRPTEGNDEPVPVKPARLDDGTWGVRLPKGVKGATG